jgi:DNA-directed RNA polymerase specialized sigma24 family protein
VQTLPDRPSTPAPEATFEQLLQHPEVAVAINRVLGTYGFRQDLEDGRHTVLLMALEWKGERPTTLRGTKALCIVLAHRHGASTYRRLKRREKRGHAGLTDREDEHFVLGDTRFDVLDVKKLVEMLRASVPEHTVEAFEDIAVGTAQTEIAADRGVPHRKVRKDIEEGRKKFQKAVLLSGLGVLLAAGAMVLLYMHGRVTPGEEAHPTPSAPPSQVLVQEEPAVTPKKEQAAKLRQQASSACAARHWQECSDELDLAYALDPDGEMLPGTKQVRDQADHGMAAKVNPGAMPSTPPAPKPTPKQK